jgi:hypothetical protein
MKKISNRALAGLSLLVIPGIMLIPFVVGTPLVLIPYAMSLVGGISFGTLVGRK